MKTRCELSMPEWAVTQREEHYERMAEKGWRVESMGQTLTWYKKAQPARLHYRLEPLAVADGELPPEQLELYEECGWDPVGRTKNFQLFYSEAENAPELHTDAPLQEEMLRPVKKRLMGQLWAYLAQVAVIVGMWTMQFVITAGAHRGSLAQRGWVALLEGGELLMAMGMLTVLYMGHALMGVAVIRQYCRTLRRGEKPPRGRLRWLHWAEPVRFCLWAVLVGALCWQMLGYWFETDVYSRESVAAEEPLLLLEEVQPGALLQGEEAQRKNGVVRVSQHLLLEKQLTCWQQHDVDVWFRQRYYRLAKGVPVQRSAEAVMACYSLERELEPERGSWPGLDYVLETPGESVWHEFVAVKGRQVMMVEYSAGMDREALLNAAAAELARHEG